jgi:HlyD family secretion protein
MTNNSRRLAALVAVLAIGATAASGCNLLEAQPNEEIYQGTAELHERVLAFELPGRVTELRVREGDRVATGDVLAVIDGALDQTARKARDLEAQAAEVQATLVKKGVRGEEIAVTRARLRAAQASEDLLKKQLERERELNRKGVVADARVDEVEASVARAVAEREVLTSVLAEQRRGARPEERDMASTRAAAARASVALDDLRLERRELRALSDGVVLDVHAEVGEVVAPGTPVLTVADPNHVYAYVFVPQAKLPGIDVGDRARVRADGIDAPLSGYVEHIARRTEFTPRYLFSDGERSNLVVRVKVHVEDPKSLLHAGVPVFAEIERATPPEARKAVLADRDQPSGDASPPAEASGSPQASASSSAARPPGVTPAPGAPKKGTR